MSYGEMPLAISLSPILTTGATTWTVENMASPVPIYSSFCCSREVLWYPFNLKADGVPEWGGGGRMGGPGGKTYLF